jgi:hypothetical protein
VTHTNHSMATRPVNSVIQLSVSVTIWFTRFVTATIFSVIEAAWARLLSVATYA